MRDLNKIILHCSATQEGKDYSVATIRGWHLKRGWRDIGYHYVIRLNGDIEAGRPLEQIGAHTQGQNTGSIGICYIGGITADGKPKDTLTAKQENALVNLIADLRKLYGPLTLHGHNEYSSKACPSFKVPEKFPHLLK